MHGADMAVDDMAIAVTRHPEALLSALRKLRDDDAVVSNVPEFTAPLWFEPLPHDGGFVAVALVPFAVAPRLDARIARLEQRAVAQGHHPGTEPDPTPAVDDQPEGADA